MNLFGCIGIFFICGGGLFVGAALSMCRGKRITAVEAKVVELRTPEEAEESEDGGLVEYEFVHEGKTQRISSRSVTSREVGESERLYYDTFSGALYHPRMLGMMGIAAAAFAGAGILMILFQHVLM